jgi:hypothetical protein
MTADWKSLCAELLRGLDENRHPEVCYPGHLRVAKAASRAAEAATYAASWQQFNPCGLLQMLIAA